MLFYWTFLDVQYRSLDNFIYIVKIIFIVVVSIKLFFKAYYNKQFRFLLIIIGIFGLLLSTIFIISFNFSSNTYYEDYRILKSDDQNFQLILQYCDEGALGGHYRVIKTKDSKNKIRLCFKKRRYTVDGDWKVFNEERLFMKKINFKQYQLNPNSQSFEQSQLNLLDL
jgi:hypothetical protein